MSHCYQRVEGMIVLVPVMSQHLHKVAQAQAHAYIGTAMRDVETSVYVPATCCHCFDQYVPAPLFRKQHSY